MDSRWDFPLPPLEALLLDDELSELELLFLLSLELDFFASLISRLYHYPAFGDRTRPPFENFGAFIEFATPAQDPSRIA